MKKIIFFMYIFTMTIAHADNSCSKSADNTISYCIFNNTYITNVPLKSGTLGRMVQVEFTNTLTTAKYMYFASEEICKQGWGRAFYINMDNKSQGDEFAYNKDGGSIGDGIIRWLCL